MIKTDFSTRTDLAMESRERFINDNIEISGVIINEIIDKKKDIKITKVKIETENGAKQMGKPKGNYITLEAPGMSESDYNYNLNVSEKLSELLREYIPVYKTNHPCALIVGLGNRLVTADSLGPEVIEHIKVTRHIEAAFGVSALESEKEFLSCTVIPGVMAQSGMESSEFIQGIVKKINPDIVIVIDALAARSAKRLNRTIQLSDTGICPGSGVGNHRNEISKKTLGVPVLAIGVPTVVEAASIVADSEGKIDTAPFLNGLYVTPKDIDEAVRSLAQVIANAINKMLAG